MFSPILRRGHYSECGFDGRECVGGIVAFGDGLSSNLEIIGMLDMLTTLVG
jgi:hypothetical protein